MSRTIRVDLHCHSNLSDGHLPPEQVAECLAKAGVQHAALTDHDTIDGLERFESALERLGIGFLPGVEITARAPGGMIHLLAYGFDPGDRRLCAMLAGIRRQHRGLSPAVILDDLKALCNFLLRWHPRNSTPEFPSCEPGVRDVAEVVHGAGGLLFLAHPLVLQPEPAGLNGILEDLKQQGLDGLEAIYGPYDEEARAGLLRMAGQHRLLISFGTDFHGGPHFPGLGSIGIDIPEDHWTTFREAVGSPNQAGDG